VVLEVEMFGHDSLVFPNHGVIIGHGRFEKLDEAPFLFQGQVIESDIDSPSYSMCRPFVMPIEGIVSRDDCWGEVLPEHGFESLDDIDKTFFKLGVKLHDHKWFLEGVFHYVVMGRTCLQGNIVIDVVYGMVVRRRCLFCHRSMGPTAVRRLGTIRVEDELITHDNHDGYHD
jgi:hypothetical protein